MALSFSSNAIASSNREPDAILRDMETISDSVRIEYHKFRDMSAKCQAAKGIMTYIDKLGSVENYNGDPKIKSMIDRIKSTNPRYTSHDIYVGIENVLEDYAKKISAFSQTMVSTIRKYSSSLFEFTMKKLRVNKAIDTSKFVQIDASMRMVVMSYGDYVELGDDTRRRTEEINSQISTWFGTITNIKKLLADNKLDKAKVVLGNFVKAINESILVKFLKDSNLIELVFDTSGSQVDGSIGIVKVNTSKRFDNLEQSSILGEVGWGDVNRVKSATVLKDSEEISKCINALYKTIVDFMDESRRISNESCVKDPYICSALVKYSSLLAQMANIYVKTYDMCWTTCLRVCQACMVEQQ